MKIDYKNFDPKKLDAIEIEGIDGNDYPDFSDAYITTANYDGVELSADELIELFEEFPGYESELILDRMY
ncbi:hypothetical protein LCGC14_0433010 [marine sediment metagenome]|uniref:Uncharacterized protein n=1 Tax=marine sediment metagenome TaxID=412755 RepID=A0A0F9V9Q5_9ZZZZ